MKNTELLRQRFGRHYDNSFAARRTFSATLQALQTDRAVKLAVRQDSSPHHNISNVQRLIDHDIFNIFQFHIVSIFQVVRRNRILRRGKGPPASTVLIQITR